METKKVAAKKTKVPNKMVAKAVEKIEKMEQKMANDAEKKEEKKVEKPTKKEKRVKRAPVGWALFLQNTYKNQTGDTKRNFSDLMMDADVKKKYYDSKK